MCLDQANSGTKLLLMDLRLRAEIEVPTPHLERTTGKGMVHPMSHLEDLI